MSVPYVIYGVLGLSCGILCFFIPGKVEKIISHTHTHTHTHTQMYVFGLSKTCLAPKLLIYYRFIHVRVCVMSHTHIKGCLFC